MSFYHHHGSGQFQQDSNLPSSNSTEQLPSWETIDQPQQQPQQQQQQDSPSDHTHSAFVSPAAPTPHALPPQPIDFSPLPTPIDYARRVRSEGEASPEGDFHQPSPSPTTPTAIHIPRATRSRDTGRSTGQPSTSRARLQTHPYRPQSALAGRSAERTGARFSVVGGGGGIQSYPASMSAPEAGPRCVVYSFILFSLKTVLH
ncbi:hypothetical protein BT96DRAFT_638486 [Gymnopus androsaceus JB14]|uniref:Uncharacterized protein n=1 Tax=Gymnopus androsaceus JB14 TaxID=1447944 RepID=A0A6A4HRB4_9AGAR|nr:hypothetical protein BT96DRAFT_638486 [Gymnopus androsaceus JB14]